MSSSAEHILHTINPHAPSSAPPPSLKDHHWRPSRLFNIHETLQHCLLESQRDKKKSHSLPPLDLSWHLTQGPKGREWIVNIYWQFQKSKKSHTTAQIKVTTEIKIDYLYFYELLFSPIFFAFKNTLHLDVYVTIWKKGHHNLLSSLLI